MSTQSNCSPSDLSLTVCIIVYLIYDNILAVPHSVTSYKMEVLRSTDTKARPLFRVTSDDGVQVSESTFLSNAVLIVLSKKVVVLHNRHVYNNCPET
jgi:hypothetical protein